MSQTAETRPRGRSADRVLETSYASSNDGSHNAILAENFQAEPCPIVAGCTARMTADALGEAIEFAVAYGTGILKAIREADDQAIIENFRFFDASARCARRAAEDLRALTAPF